MDRRVFLGAVAGTILAVPLVCQGQQAGKIYRVGVLFGGASGSDPNAVEGLQQGLREIGAT
jgi:hypothetical protein